MLKDRTAIGGNRYVNLSDFYLTNVDCNIFAFNNAVVPNLTPFPRIPLMQL